MKSFTLGVFVTVGLLSAVSVIAEDPAPAARYVGSYERAGAVVTPYLDRTDVFETTTRNYGASSFAKSVYVAPAVPTTVRSTTSRAVVFAAQPVVRTWRPFQRFRARTVTKVRGAPTTAPRSHNCPACGIQQLVIASGVRALAHTHVCSNCGTSWRH